MYTLEFKDICMSFAGVEVLHDIGFSAKGGEVLALMGENGAGKSTLLKILNGDYQQTSGIYLIDGQEQHFINPHQAIENGIGLIYQERQIAEEMNVAENVFMGNLPRKGMLVDFGKLYRDTQELIDELELPICPTDKAKDLSVAMQQMVEIMKAYSRNPKVLAFDEPTASLSDKEADVLFALIERLKKQGIIIIYVSHRMKEIFRIADRIVVLKDGGFVSDLIARDTGEEQLVELMVGRPMKSVFSELPKTKAEDEIVLDVCRIKNKKFAGESFQLKKGEVLGFFGLVGAGRTELMRAVFGADPIEEGQIFLNGNEVQIKEPLDAIRLKIAYCSEDRKQEGIIPLRSVRENISLVVVRRLRKGIFINSERERAFAENSIEKFNIKTSSQNKPIIELSGGNQQKALLARWLASDPSVIILDEPTKGIDVGAKEEIYKMIREIVSKGVSVIVISSELPEIIGLSDRMVIMRNYQIVGELDRAEATEERALNMAMLGSRQEEREIG